MDGSDVKRESCGRGGVGGGFCSDTKTRGESGSGWMKVGGDKKEKSSGTLGSPLMVYNII